MKCYKIKPFYISIPCLKLYGKDNENIIGKKQPFENFYCLFLDDAQMIKN